MYTRKIYKAFELALWTRFETLRFLVIGAVWVAAYELAGLDWLEIPWTPLALIGTAVAFLIGFQNNAAYGRIWEARKIWGGILNESRAFGTMIRDMITNDHAAEPVSDSELKTIHQRVVHRHLAWLPASRVRPHIEQGTLAELPLETGARRATTLYLTHAGEDRVGPAVRHLAGLLTEECASYDKFL